VITALRRLLFDEGSGDPRRRRARPVTPEKRSPQPRRTKGSWPGQRGIALVMVMAMVVFLTAFIVEFSYQSRVQYLQGANYRDSVRALYLAKSGVRIYTLFMSFAQMMASNPMIQQYTAGLGFDLGDKLWQQVPFIDTAFLRVAMGGGLMDMDEMDLAALQNGPVDMEIDARTQERIDRAIDRESTALTRSFLDFEGDFRAEINDEDGKLNLNSLAEVTAEDLRLNPFALAIHGMMVDERYDEMFQIRSEYDRWEVIGNIKDYIDTDNERSSFMGGYEDSLYDDADIWGRNFKPKNLPFDALDEVQMVAGVNDEIYQTFGPQWTIYGNNKVNITTCSPAILYGLIRAFSDYTVNEIQIQAVLGELQFMRLMNMLTTETFMAKLDEHGITLTDRSGLQGLIKTNSRHFTISSTGYVGDVETTLEVVMNFKGSRYTTLSWVER
jgi:type II secretory pathway component PulK